MGSIPDGDSDSLFVPCSCNVDQFAFYTSLLSLKSTIVIHSSLPNCNDCNSVLIFYYYFTSDLDEDFVISPSTDTRVQKNSLLALRCKPPAGNPRPALSWWKDGYPVDTHNNKRLLVKSDTNSSLVIIRKAKLTDSGDYSCVASNFVGRRESAIVNLNVYGKFTTCMYNREELWP